MESWTAVFLPFYVARFIFSLFAELPSWTAVIRSQSALPDSRRPCFLFFKKKKMDACVTAIIRTQIISSHLRWSCPELFRKKQI